MGRLIVIFLVVFACDFGVECCSKGDLVQDITDGFKVGTAIIKDDVRYEPKNYYIENETIFGCVCEVTKCLRKCCPEGLHPVRIGTDRICKPSKQHLSVAASLSEIPNARQYKVFHAGFLCNTPNSLALNETNWDKDLNGGYLNAFGMSLGVNDFCLDYVKNRLTSIICVTTETEAVFKSVGMYW